MQRTKATLKARISISILICGILLFWGFQAIGEEWNAEEKEVWKVVEADFELFKKGDLERIMASRHDDVLIWWGDRPNPFDKGLSQYNYKGWFDFDIPVNWELEPLGIKVSGKVAIVAFSYKFSGNVISGNGRIMETWVKQDNSWLMMGSMGASCDKLPPCK